MESDRAESPESEEEGVRVVVVADAAEADDPLGALAGLRSLGSGVQFALAADAESCAAECRAEAVDLIAADAALWAECERILAVVGEAGPPVVVAGRELSDQRALELFRLGAADCVVLPPDGGAALAVAALEQIRRSRAARSKERSRRRIRDLQRFNEGIIQNLNSALVVVDVDGRITAANPPAEEILGETGDALSGEPFSRWLATADGGESLVARTLREGARFKAAETTVTREDGTRVPVGISCAPWFDSAGRRLGAVATFQDLTGIVQLQSQVLQTEKLASIGQLAAGVAHEINNPMGFIHANLFQMSEYLSDLRRVWTRVTELQEAVGAGDLDKIRRASAALDAEAEDVDVAFLLSDLTQAVRESQEGSERIRHIVQDLRHFSHCDASERSLADVNQCLDSTATIVWPMMKHLVVLEKDYGELPSVPCYPMQLKQVFMNLLVNAYQAIEQRLGESGETGRIALCTRHVEGGVAASVSDTGVGIAPENLDRIFDPFFTTKGVGEGTGLGLSTSYSIVQRHGGRIEASSRAGGGATFQIFLPLEPEPGDDESG